MQSLKTREEISKVVNGLKTTYIFIFIVLLTRSTELLLAHVLTFFLSFAQTLEIK